MAKNSKLARIEIESATNGGFVVTHQMKPEESKSGMVTHYPQPEKHVFGPKDKEAALKHISEHMDKC